MALTSYSYEAAIILFCTVSGFNKKIHWQNLRCEIMTMGKTSKVVVCGTKKCGKTSILEQAINGKLGVSIPSTRQYDVLEPLRQSLFCFHIRSIYIFQPFYATQEDIYEANIDTDRGTKENIRFYDTQGIDVSSPSIKDDLPKHLFALADAYIIVYSIDDESSFQVAEAIRKEIDKQTRERKETIVILLGNKCDLLAKRKVDSVQALNWASRERL